MPSIMKKTGARNPSEQIINFLKLERRTEQQECVAIAGLSPELVELCKTNAQSCCQLINHPAEDEAGTQIEIYKGGKSRKLAVSHRQQCSRGLTNWRSVRARCTLLKQAIKFNDILPIVRCRAWQCNFSGSLPKGLLKVTRDRWDNVNRFIE